MKKILFVVSNIKKWWWAEDYARVLSKSLLDMWYKLELLTFYDFEDEYDIWDLNRISFNDKYSNNLFTKLYRFFVKYPRLLNKNINVWKYDLIITNAEDANLVWLNVKKYLSKKIKLITVMHNYLWNHPIYKYTQKLHKNSDYVVCVSRYISKYMGTNFLIKNIVSIYNPFDIDLINKYKKEELSLEDKRLFKNKTNLITLWRLSEQKNYFFMIDSLEKILKEKENLQWLILWDGPLKNQIIDYIKSKWLQDKIRLLWVKSNPFKYLYNSDVFVFWSTHEWFGRVLAESLICWTKTISVNCPSGPSDILADKPYSPDLVKWYDICNYWILVEMWNHEAFSGAVIYMLENNLDFDVEKSIYRFSKNKVIEEWNDLLNKI